MGAPQSSEVKPLETVIGKPFECFRADALIPVGACHPIAHLSLIITNRDVAVILREIANAADWLIRLSQYDGPDGVVAEESADGVEAFFDVFVWRPTCPWPNDGVAGIFV